MHHPIYISDYLLTQAECIAAQADLSIIHQLVMDEVPMIEERYWSIVTNVHVSLCSQSELTSSHELMGIIWIKSKQTSMPFSESLHVFGGDFNLPSYRIKFAQEAGHLMLMPATRHFTNQILPTELGDLLYFKIEIDMMDGNGHRWIYERDKFTHDNSAI
jgi:hypothetical protein